MNECNHLVGRMRAICRGESGLDLITTNQYRVRWGLPALTALVVPSEHEPTAVARPSLLQRAWTFTKALTGHAADLGRKRSEQEIAAVLSVCESCPFFDKSYCLKCGCGCSADQTFFNKLSWRSEKCPDGRWS